IRLLRGEGICAALLLALAIALAAGGVVVEPLLLRAALDLGRDLGLAEQRLLAAGYFFAFAAVLLGLELLAAAGLARLGRRLEVRLRAGFLDKIARLPDAYLRSRPPSDLAERSHALHLLRLLPRLAGQFARAAVTLGLTGAAIVWIDQAAAPAVATAAAF